MLIYRQNDRESHMQLLTTLFARCADGNDRCRQDMAVSTLQEAAQGALAAGAKTFQTYDVTSLIDAGSTVFAAPPRNFSAVHHVGIDKIYTAREAFAIMNGRIDPPVGGDDGKTAYIRVSKNAFAAVNIAQKVYDRNGREIWPSPSPS